MKIIGLDLILLLMSHYCSLKLDQTISIFSKSLDISIMHMEQRFLVVSPKTKKISLQQAFATNFQEQKDSWIQEVIPTPRKSMKGTLLLLSVCSFMAL